ncbi:MAG: HYR domain-containing protein [Pseudomonadota bacterium]
MTRSRLATYATLAARALVLALAGAAAAAPILTLPGNITAEAQGPSGAVVTYSATATNPAGKALTVSCSPASGSTFPLGTTTVTCNVIESDGTTSATGSFTVTVVDTTPPAISGTVAVTVEAVGPTGAPASYALPTASDTVAGSVPVTCAPASGSTFPVGSTTVTCSASDGHGNTATSTGTVTVADRTPPTLTAPAPITVGATTSTGIPASDARIAAFLSSATATDAVTAAPAVTNDAPAVFAVGTTTVHFTAKDAAGNTASGSSTVTVTPPPPGAPPPAGPPAAPPTPPTTAPPTAAAPGATDRTPPADVTGVKARPVGSGAVAITWRLPPDADFDHVRVLRSLAADPATTTAVYEGSATTFRDAKLRNGVTYRYVIVAVDRSGNRSSGVAFAFQPRATLLWAPADGARIVDRPLFVWARVAGASYYNVQVFRGNRKVFTAWPTATRLRLPASWRFGGERRRLTAGTYRWYVWPGYGTRAKARYGQVLGTSTFTVVVAR